MLFPDYNWNNKVNLISSIKWFCDVKSDYNELFLLKSDYLKKYDNVVLFLVDALWYNWLEQYWKDSFLYSKLKWSYTSVFPSTTATAITTINTWFTASEHAIMWWNMYSREIWWIMQILPWKHKISKASIWDEFLITEVIVKDSFYSESSKDVIIVTSENFDASRFNDFYDKNAVKYKYDNLSSCFTQTLNAVNHNTNKKYISVYWGLFDKLCHDYWVDSKEVFDHFQEMDKEFRYLESKLKEINTLIIVTADHWQLNCPTVINLKDEYKHINDMLLLPMAWEQRYQYCYVKHWLLTDFYNAVKNELGFMSDIFTKEEVLEQKLFGYWNNEKFLDRIWDFIIMPKDWYALTDWSNVPHVGYHWGLSDWEVKVPLIYFE